MEKSSDFYSLFHPIKCWSGRHLPNDRISSLPDELLLTVVSFLPLKEMVKTSILSTRWLNLWFNTPVLDFHFDLPPPINTFHDYALKNMIRDNVVKFISHILQHYKGLSLKKFRICYNLSNDYRDHIDRWLEFAFTMKLEILDLSFLESGDTFGCNYDFPDCWFNSGNANLDCCKTRVLQSNLKCLQLLSLKNVNVTGEAINFFLQNCRFLQRLELVGNSRLVSLVISDPTLVLKYLQIKGCPKLKVLSISNCNLVSLDTTFGDLNLKDLPMLVELSIVGGGYLNSLRHNLSQNATCLHQLESLKLLCAFQFEEFTEVLSNLAQMTKLKRLVIRYASRYDVPLIELLSILKSCNRLEEFVLELDWVGPERSSRTMWKAERQNCLSLKRFEFKGYYGRVSDFEFIIHLVKNAPSLEKIIIEPSHILMRSMNYPETATEQEARKFALIHIQNLKEFKYIPPPVDVLIR